MRFIICIFSLLVTLHAEGQSPVFKSDFNDGTVDDEVLGLDGTRIGAQASCGVSDSAMAFDGASSISYPTEVGHYLSDIFTLSFYLQIENTQESLVDLFSVRNECTRDTAFSITYFPPSRQLLVEFIEDNEALRLEAQLDENICWHHVVITYSLADLRLYINKVQVDFDDNIISPIVIDSTATFDISDSPCVGSQEIRFEGKIDDVCIYDQALDEFQIRGINLGPDEILTKDTSIFLGSSVIINTGESCADDFTWTPGDGVSAQVSEPIITPTITTTYNWTVDYGFCSATDSIRITVIDPEDVQCDDISLPTAFTPNGDGLNDDFGISNPIIIEDLNSFEIFDKWGALMYIGFDKDDKWDGLFRGTVPNTNTFLYKLNYQCKGQEFSKTGSFTILR